jgi:hypothetical protein
MGGLTVQALPRLEQGLQRSAFRQQWEWEPLQLQLGNLQIGLQGKGGGQLFLTVEELTRQILNGCAVQRVDQGIVREANSGHW